MFYPRGDDVIANIAPCKVDTFEREIVGLAAAAGEDDFIVLAAEQRRNLPTCFFEGGLGRRSGPMIARWIAEAIRKKRHHRRADRRINGRTCIVIEVDASHGQNTNRAGASRRPL